MQYTVKVLHRRFLNKTQAENLTSFGIKVVLNNHVYGEYSAHFPSKVELTEEQLQLMKDTFSCIKVDEEQIVIDFTGV